MSRLVVEGSLHKQFGDSDSSDEDRDEDKEEELDLEDESQRQLSPGLVGSADAADDDDSEEEELENFTTGTVIKSTVKVSSKIRSSNQAGGGQVSSITASTTSSTADVPTAASDSIKPQRSLIDAMQDAVNRVEQQSQSQWDTFGDESTTTSTPTATTTVSTSASATSSKKPVPSVTVTDEKEDMFGIAYKPFKRPSPKYTTPGVPGIDDDAEYAASLASLRSQSEAQAYKNATADDDDEFDFADAGGGSNAAAQSEDALQQAFARAAINVTEIVEDVNASVEAGVDDDDGGQEREAKGETEEAEEEKIDVRRGAQDAFNELKSIYSSGLGDVEVRLLDSNLDRSTSASSSALSATTKKSNAPSKTVLTSTAAHKSILKDVIEEGDEEAEAEEEIREAEVLVTKSQEQQRLEDEWNSLAATTTTAGGGEGGAVASGSAYDVLKDNETKMQLVTYDSLLEHLGNEDLSKFKSMIVTKETQASSWSLGSLGATKLKFPGCEEALEYPFLVAQLDYDPSKLEHLGCLRHIYKRLIFANTPDSEYISCPAYGPHWERIGFQGLDPVTDLNRSMKMFAVMQALHMIDTDIAFSRKLHDMSGSNSMSPSAHSWKRTSAVDKSWPFMCVSIMFTKEAIQALRRGDLNKKCNKRQNVLSVLHDYHHACFYDFAKRLAASNKHHAEVLKDLRDYCLSNSSQLLRSYRAAVKNRTDELTDDLISGFLEHPTTLSAAPVKTESSASRSRQKSAPTDREINNFDNLETSEEELGGSGADGSTTATREDREGEGFWSSVGLGGRANKFKA